MRLVAFLKIIFVCIFFQSCKDHISIETMYYDNGTIKSEITYKDSLKFGKARYYYSNGFLKEELTYENDMIQGNYISFDDEGFVSSTGQFLNGFAVGPLYYYKKGKLVLYNERNFAGDIYYVRKYDPITQDLIKEEGVCLNLDSTAYSSLKIDKKNFIFFYSQPSKCINELNCFINDMPFSFDTLNEHIGIVRVDKIKDKIKTLKIFSKLKTIDENRVICYDSLVSVFD